MSGSRAFLVAVFVATAGGAAPAAADEPPAKEDPSAGTASAADEPGFETVVTASREEQPRLAAPRSVAVVTSERAAEIGAADVPGSLIEVPGVEVQRTNRGAGSPIIRGLIGPQNLILVDGVRFNNSTFRTGPNQYLATFPPWAVERIEVLRGPSSVLHGDGAMGGVIHLATADPRSLGAGPHARASTFFASADTSTGADLRVGAGLGDLALLGGVGFATFDDLRAGGGLVEPASGYHGGGGNLRFSWLPGPSGLEISGAWLGARTADAGRTDRLGAGEIRFYDNDDHLAWIEVAWKGSGVLRKIALAVSYHRMEERVDRYGCLVDAAGLALDQGACASRAPAALERWRVYEDAVDTLGGELISKLDLFDRRLRLTTGAALYQDFVASGLRDARAADGFAFEDAGRGNFSDDSRYRTLGAFLHGDLLLWRFADGVGELRAGAGGRWSHFAAFAPDVPGIGDVEYGHGGFVGEAGLRWITPERLTVWGSWAQGLRAPNLQESTVLGDTGSKFEVPNEDLRPERLDTLEIGTRLELDPLALEAAWYRSWIADAMDEEPATWQGRPEVDGAPVIRRVNAERGVLTGVEGGASLRFWRLILGGGLGWMRGTLEDDAGSHPARRIPPLTGLGSLRYDSPGRERFAELALRFAAAQRELHPSDEQDLRICEDGYHTGALREPCAGTPGWYSLDWRGGLRLFGAARLVLALSNLTDQRYKPHGSGFHAPGFDARLLLTVER
jgi:outer membrane receptor protein involved in Fe transport